MTREGTPDDLKEGSTWQYGPEFLKWPVEEWPIKSAREVAAYARESVNTLQREAFSAAIARAQAEAIQQKADPQATQGSQDGKPTVLREKPTGWVKDLMDLKRFSNLSKLVRVIAWVQRAAKQWLKRKCQTPGQP